MFDRDDAVVIQICWSGVIDALIENVLKNGHYTYFAPFSHIQ